MNKLLIVSPRFPPTNAADHQRVRMCLPHFRRFGWDPTVLAVRPACVEAEQDQLLVRTIPEELRVEWVNAWPPRWTRFAGVGSLWARSWTSFALTAQELFRQERFDLVFFSTTEFPLMMLGPRWKRRHGVPYVLDMHDPWVTDYYRARPELKPPGGRLKYGLSQWLARRAEPRVVREASHLVCVSPAYPDMLRTRYPSLPTRDFTVSPFGAAESDVEVARSSEVSQSIFNPHDGRTHWVYVGAIAPAMAFSLRAFFTALRRAADKTHSLEQQLTIHFVGTDYAPAHSARRSVDPVATECGVSKMVTEQPARIGYFQALRCLLDADALVSPGSDDPGYTPSKIYPLILARKPWLAVFHKNSSAVEVIAKTRAGTVVTFDSSDDLDSVSRAIEGKWFNRLPSTAPNTDWGAFEAYSAQRMTQTLCAVFDSSRPSSKTSDRNFVVGMANS